MWIDTISIKPNALKKRMNNKTFKIWLLKFKNIGNVDDSIETILLRNRIEITVMENMRER